MSSWHSYPSIFNLGHRAVRDLLNYPHVVEEKVDGSQFSFGLIETDFTQPNEGELILRVRSKGAEMNVDAPEKMFTKAVETAKRICSTAAEAAGVGAHPGWTYRCEYLAKPKHNTLAYDRVPTGHLIGFDVSTDDSTWLTPDQKREEFARIGLECVPVLNERSFTDFDHTDDPFQAYSPLTLENIRHLLDTKQSVLGGQLIEGVVIKPLVELYGVDKKTLMGKFVSERFKEAHKEAWKETSPTSGDILDRLAKTYTTTGRWMKAVQHLRESGQLTDSPKDIGLLIPEVAKDLGQEEKTEIQRLLWKWAWPHIQRAVTRGLPEWYKQELLKLQFEQDHLGVTSDSGTPVAVEPIDDEPSSCRR